jgi:phosphate/sulfate permease/DNA-binding CsgD family transcriptional regulator
MLIWIFISSGLFLGWSLGANDAANIFGTAVGSRMIKFRTAAIIASIFVVLGAVFQGYGASDTLSQLGSIDALGGAFTVSLCSAVIVTLMTKNKLPVSTGQAIVGAIIGWCYFTSNPVDYVVLTKIVGSWISGPILGAVFSAILFILLRKYLLKSKLHLIKQESIIRMALIVTGAFGAYSLGANNIANVMGVFVNSVKFTIHMGPITLNSAQVLFFIGSLAISVGIITYGKKVMETIGGELIALTPESAIVVVLSQALVLFIFSSTTLSNVLIGVGLPPIPLVPVSSTQVVVGSVIGIGLVKGLREMKFKVLGSIMIGWILTPLLSGILTFFSLFFVSSVFGIAITNKAVTVASNLSTNPINTVVNIPFEFTPITYIAVFSVLIIISTFVFFAYRKSKSNIKANENRWAEQLQFAEFQKALTEIEVNTIHLENGTLATRLEEKKKELVTYCLNIGQQRELLDSITKAIENAVHEKNIEEKNHLLLEEIKRIKQKMSFTSEAEKIYQDAEQAHNEFSSRLLTRFPNLSQQERRLMILLRIGLSSKEIAPLLNISVKSVEISRYRLRKKLNLDKDSNLVDFTKTL